jgi:exonuclease III
MKIVTWNCNGALRNKFENLKEFDADVFIIQECENPSESIHKEYQKWAENYLWIGNTKNKGLGVFAKKQIDLKALDWSNLYKDHEVKYFLPCQINDKIDLIAVWTHQNNSPNFGYIGQLWKYLQIHKSKLKNTIIAGDFNSNVIWDQWDRWWNHSDVVRELEEINIKSFYHLSMKEEQGKESIPTFFLHRKPEKPYHIDYIFGSKQYYDNLKSIKIGSVEKWLKFSDHMPLFAEF